MTFTKKSTKEILHFNTQRNEVEGMKHLKIWLHNIRSLHNIGSAFRSCDAFGAGEMYLSGFTATPPRPEITKTALGADEYVGWKRIERPVESILSLKNEGYQILGIEQTHNSVMLPEFRPDRKQKLCLIFGNEVTGIDEELIPHLDQCLEIPQFGQKHSLNISVTVGVVLYHLLNEFSN